MTNTTNQITQKPISELEEIEKTDSVDCLLDQASKEENLEKILELIVQAIVINSLLTSSDING